MQKETVKISTIVVNLFTVQYFLQKHCKGWEEKVIGHREGAEGAVVAVGDVEGGVDV